MNLSEIENERRNPKSRMTDEKFRQYTLDTFMLIQNRLEHGNTIMQELSDKIDSHFKIHAQDISELKVQVDINTDLTRKTSEDTAGLVAIYNAGKKTADAVSSGTRNVSRWAKILLPIITLLTVIGAWLGGHFPKLADLLRAMK